MEASPFIVPFVPRFQATEKHVYLVIPRSLLGAPATPVFGHTPQGNYAQTTLSTADYLPINSTFLLFQLGEEEGVYTRDNVCHRHWRQ